MSLFLLLNESLNETAVAASSCFYDRWTFSKWLCSVASWIHDSSIGVSIIASFVVLLILLFLFRMLRG